MRNNSSLLCGFLLALLIGVPTPSTAQSVNPPPAPRPSAGQPPVGVIQLPQPLAGDPQSEKPLRAGEGEAAQTVPRVGYDAFNVDVASIPSGPVDEFYRLSPGDEVHLRVWGRLQLTYQLTVTPDQYLEVPDVPGRVYVGGLTLLDVTDRLRRHLATAYATYFDLDNPANSPALLDVSLAKVRDIRFLVQGEVITPGSFGLHPSLGNLIYAIARAGGIKESGSMREIRIRRGDQVLSVDFYDFLIKGTMDPARLRIQNGDVIFVPIKRKEVTLQGEVRRPGVYTLHSASTEDLEAVLDFAGGLLQTASTDNVLIRRSEINVGQRTLSVNLGAERAAKQRVPLVDGDLISVVPATSSRRDFVTLQGNGVLVPGEYQYVRGMKVADLLQSAGGLAPEAYRERAELRRTNPDMREEYMTLNLGLALSGDPAHNILVSPLDALTVFSVTDVEGLSGSVTIRGHVKQPGSVPLARGMRLSDLLFARAGVQDRDFMRDTYLTRADLLRVVPGANRQELQTFDLGRLLTGDTSQDQLLQADDVVVVYDRREVLGSDRFVMLSGHAKNVGRHPFQQGMRVGDLLRAVGGYEDPDFRRQAYLPRGDVWRTISRGNRLDRELLRFDLGALLEGDLTQNLPLQSGDEVVVYAASDFEEPQRVQISGAVNRPGEYELASNMTVADLLIRAGGLKEMADPTTGELFRVAVGDDGQVALTTRAVSLSDSTFVLKNRDRLLVRLRSGAVTDRVVAVSGQVQFPGEYALDVNGRVSDLIRMAGGLLPGAFPEGAVLSRAAAVEGTGYRVVFDLERALKDPESSDNLLLINHDRLSIPRRLSTVTVIDEVERQITIAWKDGKGVKYYLEAAGGPTAEANEKDVRVLLPNGRFAPTRFLRGPEILPGSTIMVPARVTATPRGDGDAAPQRVEPRLEGRIENLRGTCPSVQFQVGPRRVTTSEATMFVGLPCAELKAGYLVTVSGIANAVGSFGATEVMVARSETELSEFQVGAAMEAQQRAAPASATSSVAAGSQAPPGLSAPPEASPATPSSTVRGAVTNRSGACPLLAFDLGNVRVTTTEATTYVGVTCTAVNAGQLIEVVATRINDRVVVATEIRRR